MLLPTDRLLTARHGAEGPRLQKKTDAHTSDMFGDLLEPVSSETNSEAASSAEAGNDTSSDVLAALPFVSPFGIDIGFIQAAPCSAQAQGLPGSRAELGADGEDIVTETIGNMGALTAELERGGVPDSRDKADCAKFMPREPAGRDSGIQRTSEREPSLDVRIDANRMKTAGQGPLLDRRAEGKTPEPFPPSTDTIVPPDPGASQMTIVPANSPPTRQVLTQFDQLFQGTYVSPSLPAAPAQPGNDVRSLRLTLRPDHLGDVEVSLHRTGNEMRVRIVVTNEATARSLDGDLNILREKIEALMQTEGAPAVIVSVQSPDEKLQSLLSQGGGNCAGMTASNGNPADSTGERQAPRKRVAGSNQVENDPSDRDPLLQPGLAHIVV